MPSTFTPGSINSVTEGNEEMKSALEFAERWKDDRSHFGPNKSFGILARALLAAVSETVATRNDVLEEAAKEAERYSEEHYDPVDPGYVDVASAIRALKNADPQGHPREVVGAEEVPESNESKAFSAESASPCVERRSVDYCRHCCWEDECLEAGECLINMKIKMAPTPNRDAGD